MYYASVTAAAGQDGAVRDAARRQPASDQRPDRNAHLLGRDRDAYHERLPEPRLLRRRLPRPIHPGQRGHASDYWAFATGDRFPLLYSTDLVHWTPEGTAMTARPAWVVSTGDWHSWAPSVIASSQSCPGTTSNGCYIMYYSGLSAQYNVSCIGVATSPDPGGPYSDQGPLDVTSPTARAHAAWLRGEFVAWRHRPFPVDRTSPQAYLYVRTGQCMHQRKLRVGSDDLGDLAHLRPHARIRLPRPAVLRRRRDLGGVRVSVPTVEGPFMELHNGTYYLFYSGGNFQGAYGMGYATATSPTGPFTKSATNPILTDTSTVLSPGGGDELVTGPHGGLWMLYAARESSYAAPRLLWLDPFSWRPATTAGAPDVPVISGPTSTPQVTQP